MEIRLPNHVPGMLNDVPEEDQPKGEEQAKFWRTVAYELSALLKYSSETVEPQVVLNDMRVSGSQYIWEFFVNDLSIPKSDAYNFHGQNVSQWLYAGCILVSNGQVSSHH